MNRIADEIPGREWRQMSQTQRKARITRGLRDQQKASREELRKKHLEKENLQIEQSQSRDPSRR